MESIVEGEKIVPVARGNTKAVFGEGPVWDHDNGCLLWIDNAEKKMIAFDPITEQESTLVLPGYVKSFVKYSKDELILIMKDGFYLYHLVKKTVKTILQPEGLNENLYFNDGKCDPQGRIWVGSSDGNFRKYKERLDPLLTDFKGEKASLYRLDRDLTIHKMKDKITISNGLDWDQGRNRMYYVDSATQSIFQYEFNPETGEISNEEIVYTFEGAVGFPDGMTIDKEGMLWVALFKAGPVAKVTPKHGIVAKINPFIKEWVKCIVVPTSHVTSCAFGGENFKTLFITTALEPLPESERVQQPQAGRLFSVELDVGGYQAISFQGTL